MASGGNGGHYVGDHGELGAVYGYLEFVVSLHLILIVLAIYSYAPMSDVLKIKITLHGDSKHSHLLCSTPGPVD